MNESEIKYLELLSKSFPSIPATAAEIVRLQAILELPKTTEHFMSDIHGEYTYFSHILKNASGAIHDKINDSFGDLLGEEEKNSLARLLYYPERELAAAAHSDSWYRVTIHRLVAVCRQATDKYTRVKVRARLPKEYAYIIEELIDSDEHDPNKRKYFESIINSVIETGIADRFIVALANLISRLTVNQLHIVGDVFDRGPAAQMVMDDLMDMHGVDFVWGNHDILWMGAAMGNPACIANALRNSLKYGNFDMLEDGYGLNVRPLALFAMEQYGDDPCTNFLPTHVTDCVAENSDVTAKLLKAITVIQFKLEGQVIKKHSEFEMDDRLLLDKIDYEKKTVMVYGKEYPMNDVDFPTVDPADPYNLTPDEEQVMARIQQAFVKCEKLQRHVRFLFSNAGRYKVHNSNLLYHGCVPMDEKGNFKAVDVDGKRYRGKELYDILDNYARKGYYSKNYPAGMRRAQDYIWYIWAGPNSPVFGKDKMATFERYFIEDKETHKEIKNSYYSLLDNEEVLNRILEEFGLDTHKSHIINGHVPVELKKGESPIKCDGKLLIIDGGFSKAYQSKTGIAGYTLVANSHGMRLVAHEPFESTEAAILHESDIFSDSTVVEVAANRIRVSDTDIGRELRESIKQLELLLQAYRDGSIVEKQ